jgi:uncharacterized membrane protein YvbJ
MAQGRCPDCNANVADDAAKCPRCGFPLREFFEAEEERRKPRETPAEQRRSRAARQMVYGLLAALAILSLLIVLMVWYAQSRLPPLKP